MYFINNIIEYSTGYRVRLGSFNSKFDLTFDGQKMQPNRVYDIPNLDGLRLEVTEEKVTGYKNLETGEVIQPEQYTRLERDLLLDFNDVTYEWRSVSSEYDYKKFQALWKPIKEVVTERREIDFPTIVQHPEVTSAFMQPASHLGEDVFKGLVHVDGTEIAKDEVAKGIVAGGYSLVTHTGWGRPKKLQSNEVWVSTNYNGGPDDLVGPNGFQADVAAERCEFVGTIEQAEKFEEKVREKIRFAFKRLATSKVEVPRVTLDNLLVVLKSRLNSVKSLDVYKRDKATKEVLIRTLEGDIKDIEDKINEA